MKNKMNKDIKLQLAIAKLIGETCLAIEVDEIHCKTKDCGDCPYYNPLPIVSL